MRKISADAARELSNTVFANLLRLDDVNINNVTAEGFSWAGDQLTLQNNIQINAQQRADKLATRVRYDIRGVVASDAEAEESDSDQDDEVVWAIGFDVVAYWGLRDGDTTVDSDAAHCFAYGMGLTTAHPYARSFVSDMTARLGYPVAVLEMVFNPIMLSDQELDLPDRPDTPAE